MVWGGEGVSASKSVTGPKCNNFTTLYLTHNLNWLILPPCGGGGGGIEPNFQTKNTSLDFY